MPRRARGPRRLRVLVWNVYVGQHPSKVRAALLIMIAMTWPHAIVLQEAKRFRGTLPGYRRHAADDLRRPDANNCIILVRKGLPQSGRALPVDGPGWVHKRPKPPRTFYLVEVAWLTLVAVHRCTRGMGGRNAAEWTAEHDELVEVGTTSRGPLAMDGDWNATPDRVHPTSPTALAREIGARVAADADEVIDFPIVRDVEESTIFRLPSKFGSDHRPWLNTLTRKEHR